MKQRVFNFSYRKVGGIHFVKLGRLGFNFYVSRKLAPCRLESDIARVVRRQYYGGNETVVVNADL